LLEPWEVAQSGVVQFVRQRRCWVPPPSFLLRLSILALLCVATTASAFTEIRHDFTVKVFHEQLSAVIIFFSILQYA
jgi:hypothetical protein